MKDLDPAKSILGMEIHKDAKDGMLWLTQGKYARKLLERFNMFDAKLVDTPLVNHFKHQLSTTFCPLDATEKGLMSKVPYESAIGSLMYFMVYTRPDIAYALGKVSKYMMNPGKVHWEAVKWILQYIKGTMGYGLLFDAHSYQARTLVGYVDSDYAQDLDTRQSTMGYVMTLGRGCIMRRSVLQKCETLSSTEAEYVAITKAAKEAIWLGRLSSEMGLPQGCVNLYCDNQSILYLVVNQIMSSKIKHIDVRYHVIKQVVYEGKVKLQKIVDILNPADGFTKYIPLESFNTHCAKLKILPMDEEES
ncbi:hypothetical protein R1flu_010373 [Riccia fluitans]|uniref:Reverse transcriptase Ty1/copia-type domain-containing protein n=1 Tax=Riccia fluitans TaxID=41844 RepID=A0ABD1Z4T0_9MARC